MRDSKPVRSVKSGGYFPLYIGALATISAVLYLTLPESNGFGVTAGEAVLAPLLGGAAYLLAYLYIAPPLSEIQAPDKEEST